MRHPGDDNETWLIGQIRAGQQDAFRELVEAHQSQVFRVCYHLLGDAARAEDLAQDTFVTAYRKLSQFDSSKGSFSTWILTIARRLSINAMKKLTPVFVEDLSDVPERAGDAPDLQASRADTFRLLDRALASLTATQRRAFVLAEMEGLSHAEVATIEGIAEGTVKSRVSRAKEALRALLRPTFDEMTHLLK